MRWPRVNCILLACLATAIATETETPARTKRDLQFWKNLIAAKLGLTEVRPVQNEEIKIIHMPGFENVVVKAVPKVTIIEAPAPVPERIVQVDPTMAILQSYLGTKTPDQTLFALQGMKQLMQSGVLNARQESMDLMPPQIIYPRMVHEQFVYRDPRPAIMERNPYVFESRPAMPILESPRYPAFPVSPSVVRPLPALRPLPMLPPAPVLPPYPILPRPVYPFAPMPPPMPILPPMPKPDIVVPEIRPVPPPVVRVPAVPTRFSYQQVKHDGSVTSFLSRGKQDVMVIETNKPPPPPPSYIIDRFQKIIYGLPLGVTMQVEPTLPPKPIDVSRFDVPLVPYFPGAPIITGPPDVEVKVKNKLNKTLHKGVVNMYAGTQVVKENLNPTLVHEQIVVPKPTIVDVQVAPIEVPSPPPVIVENVQNESERRQFSYNHVDAQGSITYTGNEEMKEPSSPMITEDISKLPSPLPFTVDTFDDSTGKGHKSKSTWGYSFKIANGVGTYRSPNNDKIYYSRLEPGSPKPGLSAVPDPLSSGNENETNTPNNNVYFVDKDKESNNDMEINKNSDKDEYGNPFLSTRIEGDKPAGSNEVKVETGEETGGRKILPMKMFPPLPLPIAGDNEQGHAKKVGAARFSYTLMKDSGVPVKFEGNPDSFTDKHGNVLVSANFVGIRHGNHPCKHTNRGSALHPCSNRKGPVVVHETIGKYPVLPSAVVDVVRPVQKPAHEAIGKFPVLPSAVVDVVRPMLKPAHEAIGKFPVLPSAVVDVVKPLPKPVYQPIGRIPVLPSAIVDVIKPVPKAPQVIVKEGAKLPPSVMFAQPILSRYIYKQISHTNPKPFTVVKVEDKPRIEVPRGDVKVTVNPHVHEHIRDDGSKYLCSELHLPPGVPTAPLPPIPTVNVVPTVPKSLIFVPPSIADSAPNPHDEVQAESRFSYTQVKSEGTNTTTTAPAIPTESTTTEGSVSLSLNPIVVSEDSKYSYTQTNADGSSLNVEGDKDNKVSVKLEEAKESDTSRGDIPDASA